MIASQSCPFFFFNDTATTEIYTLSLHDALPISETRIPPGRGEPMNDMKLGITLIAAAVALAGCGEQKPAAKAEAKPARSEEHTSELQSRLHLVCRLLLEKKKRHPQTPRGRPITH